jgi:hypothetical protein
LETELSGSGLQNSAKIVLLVLRSLKIADFRTLERETGLSKRSLLYAVKALKSIDLIDIQICLSDTRRRFYCIRINETPATAGI